VRSESEAEALRSIFMQRVEAWLAGDLDAYMDCWFDDLVIELPTGRSVGKERYRKLVKAGFAWAEPVSFDVHHIAFEERESGSDAGDIVLADWTIRSRRREDGAVIGWRGLSVCEIHDRHITWWREHHLEPPAPINDTLG
jgi:ketosteroid isomerase-like protein